MRVANSRRHHDGGAPGGRGFKTRHLGARARSVDERGALFVTPVRDDDDGDDDDDDGDDGDDDGKVVVDGGEHAAHGAVHGDVLSRSVEGR